MPDVMVEGLPGDILEKLKRIWGYWRGKIKAGPTTPQKYIELNKPKDIDEQTWLLGEIKRLKDKPDKGERELMTYKMLRDYALTEYGEYGQRAPKKKKEEITYPY